MTEKKEELTLADVYKLVGEVNEKIGRMLTHWGVAVSKIEDELNAVLPVELKLPQDRMRVLVKAVKRGVVSVKKGGLVWHSDKAMLLAYFCGRLWSGDYVKVVRSTGERMLMAGPIPFPSTALEDVFGSKNLRQYRSQLMNQKLLGVHLAVDELFT